MQFQLYNILTLLDEEHGIGEQELTQLLSSFMCPKNAEVEQFLKINAIPFSKRKMSITYLMLDDSGEILAYFTLTHKSTKIPHSVLSNTQYKKLLAHAKKDNSGCFDVSAFLVAQLGKNAANPLSCKLKGDELLKAAFGILENVQQYIGGGIAFLECEPEQRLLEFYQNENNRFVKYGDRKSEEGTTYCQLLRFF